MYLLVVVFIGTYTNFPNSGFNYPNIRMISKESCEAAGKKIVENTTLYVSEGRKEPGYVVPICIPMIMGQ